MLRQKHLGIAAEDREPLLGVPLSDDQYLGKACPEMVERPVASEEKPVGSDFVDEFPKNANALTVDFQPEILVPACEGNCVAHIACPGMTKDELNFGM